MKIYFADTTQRELLGYNREFPIKHHLEAYIFILEKKPDWHNWDCMKYKGENDVLSSSRS